MGADAVHASVAKVGGYRPRYAAWTRSSLNIRLFSGRGQSESKGRDVGRADVCRQWLRQHQFAQAASEGEDWAELVI